VYPATPGYKFPRELLEETVLVVQKVLEMSDAGQRIPFCAFNGTPLTSLHIMNYADNCIL